MTTKQTLASLNVIGFAFANRILTLQTKDLDATLEALKPNFLFAGKPIAGKNIQFKVELVLGQEVKAKMADVKRMKVEFAQAETATTALPEAIGKMANPVDAIAALGTELLKKPEPAPKAEKPAKAPKAEKPATAEKAADPAPTVNEEVKAAQAAEPTTKARQMPARDAKGHFIKRAQ